MDRAATSRFASPPGARAGALASLLALLVGSPLPAIPPAAAPGPSWRPDPSPWRVVESRIVSSPQGARWRLAHSVRRLGEMGGGRGGIEVVAQKIAIDRQEGERWMPMAVLLPVANDSAALLSPADRSIDAVPARIGEDLLGRWPNLCTLAILEDRQELDVDGDSVIETAIRRSCSCPASDCSEILLVELDPQRGPALLDPADLVSDLPLGRLRIAALPDGRSPARPDLRLDLRQLERCAFIGRLGVPGESDCENCCLLPVVLRAVEGSGSYAPSFDRALHASHLKRAQNDLAFAAAGPPGERLSSAELGQIARAASFFYLTGSGRQTGTLLREALGVRAGRPEVVDLLARLDGWFLRDPPLPLEEAPGNR